jgi:hypothetical protein
MLAVTLRYLASGNTFVDLHYSYRLGEKTIGNCVRSLQCIVGPIGRTTSSVPNRGVVASYY